MTDTTDTADNFCRLSPFCQNSNMTAAFGGIGGVGHLGVPILPNYNVSKIFTFKA